MSEFTYSVPGMTCGGCARTITNAVKAIDPDAVVVPELSARTVQIQSNRQSESIEAAIREAGYEPLAA